MKAVYTKGGAPWLMLTETVEDRDALIKLSEFRVRAWEGCEQESQRAGLDCIRDK